MSLHYDSELHMISWTPEENGIKWVLFDGDEWKRLINDGYYTLLIQTVRDKEWAMMTKVVN